MNSDAVPPAHHREYTTSSVPARALRGLSGLYRAWSSTRPPHCRFVPTCSAYAEEAVERHGARRGVWLALRRLTRCRPGGGWGYDPVPGPERSAATATGDRHHENRHHEEVTRVG